MGSREGSHHGAAEFDVFLNHRGPDVKNTFVAHLYDALGRDGLRPFLDAKDIGLVCNLSDSIDAALRGARVHVAIFSKGYADSPHCLSELCDMLETGKPILPVFYNVKPESLRRIESGTFLEGFKKHEGRLDSQEKIPKWKKALKAVSSKMGLVLGENGNEVQLLREILVAVRQLMRSTGVPDTIDHGVSNFGFSQNWTVPNGMMMRPEGGVIQHHSGDISSGATVAHQLVQSSSGRMSQQPQNMESLLHEGQGAQQIPNSLYLSIPGTTTTSPAGSPRELPTPLPQLSQSQSGHRYVLHRLDGHRHGEGENRPHSLGAVDSSVDSPLNTQAPEVTQNNETVTSFRSDDRRLNILLLGKPRLVKALIRRLCEVQDLGNLQESMNFSPPMCLIGDTEKTYRRNFAHLHTFVKARNKKWHCSQVEAMWDEEVKRPGPANRQASLSSSGSKKWESKKSRLHMVWFVCKKFSDLPDRFEWLKITEKLYGLPVQILVEGPKTARFHELGNEFFPNAQNAEDLIVDVKAHPDVKKTLWRVCWDAKTRSEISHAADVIRMIRKHLGPNGKSFSLGVGSGGVITKDASLRRSGEFFIHFLSTFWDVPSESIRHVLTEKTSFKQGNKISIRPSEFVKFCLNVAALILFDAHDSTGQPKYVCDSLSQFLQTNAYDHISSLLSLIDDCDRMATDDMRQFLQSVLNRKSYCVASVVAEIV